MDYRNNILYSEPYYNLTQEKSIDSVELYHKFINWTAGEFDLYLQDESMGLKVYVPNGWFSIKNSVNKKQQVYIQIEAVNKSKKACERILIQVLSIY